MGYEKLCKDQENKQGTYQIVFDVLIDILLHVYAFFFITKVEIECFLSVMYDLN